MITEKRLEKIELDALIGGVCKPSTALELITALREERAVIQRVKDFVDHQPLDLMRLSEIQTGLRAILSGKPIDPRDPDHSRSGIFVLHNCSRCSDGSRPCVAGNPSRCEYPHARND